MRPLAGIGFALGLAVQPLGAQSTEVVLLGTGMPRPNPEAAAPATAVVYGEQVFLFDAGPGVMGQLRKANLPIDGVTALFLTHLHSDHTLGYPDLMLTSWVMGRKNRMPVLGPIGTDRMTDLLLQAWSIDIQVRTDGRGFPSSRSQRCRASSDSISAKGTGRNHSAFTAYTKLRRPNR